MLAPMKTPSDSKKSDEQKPPATDPGANQNPDRAAFTNSARTRAEVHADSVLRRQTTFERHQIKDIVVSAFVSGADYAAGESTQQPDTEGGKRVEELQKVIAGLRAELDKVNEQNHDLRNQLSAKVETKTPGGGVRTGSEEKGYTETRYQRKEGETDEELEVRMAKDRGFTGKLSPADQKALDQLKAEDPNAAAELEAQAPAATTPAKETKTAPAKADASKSGGKLQGNESPRSEK